MSFNGAIKRSAVNHSPGTSNHCMYVRPITAPHRGAVEVESKIAKSTDGARINDGRDGEG